MQDHSIKLIDSTYPVSHSREVLLSLLNDKITFLGVQILSFEERFGKDTKHMKLRIKELENERSALVSYLNQLDEDTLLELDCEISIKVLSEPAIA